MPSRCASTHAERSADLWLSRRRLSTPYRVHQSQLHKPSDLIAGPLAQVVAGRVEDLNSSVPRSATYTWPAASRATQWGRSNWPGLCPSYPLKQKRPVGTEFISACSCSRRLHKTLRPLQRQPPLGDWNAGISPATPRSQGLVTNGPTKSTYRPAEAPRRSSKHCHGRQWSVFVASQTDSHPAFDQTPVWPRRRLLSAAISDSSPAHRNRAGTTCPMKDKDIAMRESTPTPATDPALLLQATPANRAQPGTQQPDLVPDLVGTRGH